MKKPNSITNPISMVVKFISIPVRIANSTNKIRDAKLTIAKIPKNAYEVSVISINFFKVYPPNRIVTVQLSVEPL